uniref:Truncated envelope glycoprotein n=1 Tax=Human immunodeficiency virus type 1 TaxID=11676 RepID=A0A0H3YD20_HV1|nr:truncated envelope glycoprotein [Human immunodeficiency virus 1]
MRVKRMLKSYQRW